MRAASDSFAGISGDSVEKSGSYALKKHTCTAMQKDLDVAIEWREFAGFMTVAHSAHNAQLAR